MSLRWGGATATSIKEIVFVRNKNNVCCSWVLQKIFYLERINILITSKDTIAYVLKYFVFFNLDCIQTYQFIL